MNQYYEAWLEHTEQLHMPPVHSTDTNEDGPYWTVQRVLDSKEAARHTRMAFQSAAAISAIDGPLPFVDVIAYGGATLYSAAWWIAALS